MELLGRHEVFKGSTLTSKISSIGVRHLERLEACRPQGQVHLT